ncbi:MAG: amidohydrolase [Rhodothermales bacterium]|nr:amidohydrolase [Rhodothermales bacterium]HAY37301.1 amidohydrolase [Bacteroidota bacterium]
MNRLLSVFFFALIVLPASGQQLVDQIADALEPKVIEWRRDFHQHPELSNREFRTAGIVAEHLASLGMEVTTEVAHTGVIGLLKGAHPGPTVALRADMDALPVKERVDLDFKSEVTSLYRGEEVPVMHACGHDTHIAMLMGAAEALAGMREDLHGTVKFIFQPAEEGSPPGEEGGAELMVKEGVMEGVDVVFGLHIGAGTYVGTIEYKPMGMMAAVDDFRIVLKGKQAHGSAPWLGIDPIVTSAQIINNLQTIVSRSLRLTKAAAVVTIGSIHGGVRSNIIPEELEMLGTIRTFDPEMRIQLHKRFRTIVNSTATSNGAIAEIQLPYSAHYPVTYNDPTLTDQMLPTLKRTAGDENVVQIEAVTGAEDFSFFAREAPGLFLFLGGKPLDVPADVKVSHHTPDFYIDESGMKLGVRTLLNLTLDYMDQASMQ